MRVVDTYSHPFCPLVAGVIGDPITLSVPLSSPLPPLPLRPSQVSPPPPHSRCRCHRGAASAPARVRSSLPLLPSPSLSSPPPSLLSPPLTPRRVAQVYCLARRRCTVATIAARPPEPRTPHSHSHRPGPPCCVIVVVYLEPRSAIGSQYRVLQMAMMQPICAPSQAPAIQRREPGGAFFALG